MITEDTMRPAVLVVDDNPLIVNVLKSLFAAQDYEVFVSRNGAEAIDMLNKKAVDVIICDVMMPKMDGYALHDQVRAKAELSHIPFVFLTALGDSAEVNRGKAAGADDYVTKPFDPRDLLALVRGKIVRSRNLKHLSEERYESYRKRVIHTLSHEFRTPLVAINTGTELLLEQQQKIDQQKALNLLEAIRRGGQRLERLVNDFMLLQQIEAGIAHKMFANRATVCVLREMVEDFIASQRDSIRQEGFRVNFTEQIGETKVKIYDPQIRDILGRLFSNCFKFKSEDRTIDVVMYPQEHEVVIEVRDRGIGLDPQRIQEAIDVFGQIDRDRLEQQGGGLGLAIANRYASINGGRLEFERRQSGGAIVSLILPVVP